MKPRFHKLRQLPAWGAAGAAGLLAIPALALAAGAGTPDANFGTSGAAVGAPGIALLADAVQSNGSIVAVGEALTPKTNTPTLVVERLTSSGAPDPSFGTNGLVVGPTVSGAAGTIGRSVAIQSNGDIVVAGQATGSGGIGNAGMLVERFTSSGALDTSFGSGGVQNIQASNNGAGQAVALAANGSILVGGSVDLNAVPYAAVSRLSASGALDPTFGTLGTAVLQIGQYATVQALALQSNGSIVVGGNESPDGRVTEGFVARLSSLGILDSSFNNTGAQVNQFAQGSGAYSSVNGVAVGADGTVYAAGNATGDNETADAFVASYTSSGAKNSSFGTGGVTVVPAAVKWIQSGTVVPGGNGLLLLSNGNLVVPGEYDNSTSTTYGTLWSFTPSGSLDASFGTGGVALLKAGTNNSTYGGAALSPSSGDIIAAGATSQLGSAPSALVTATSGYSTTTTTTTTTTTPPPTPVPLKLTITGVGAKASAKTVARSGLAIGANCNQSCKLALTFTTSAGNAKKLGIGTRVRTCKKVHGKQRCTTSTKYVGLKLSSSASLGKAGTHTFRLRLSKNLARALEKHTGTKWTLQVVATPTAKGVKKVTYKKTVQFTK